MTFMTHIRPSVLLAFLALVGPAVVTEAETRFVANNGVDSNNTCLAHPCRSIGHAIQNANSGDTIVVGPGRYSWESEPGPGFCSCVIQVDKPLTIESRDGAGVTVLDATGHTVDVVHIEANDVVFGELQKGFTLTGAVLSSAAAGSGLVILAGTSGVQVKGNLATRNDGAGFSINGGSGHHLRGNTANANRNNGFRVFQGSGVHLRGNTASANNFSGFVDNLGSGDHFRGNIASANGEAGFVLFDRPNFEGTSVLTGNAALGNKGAGIAIGSGGAVITQNNIFGNDLSTNCGLDNQSGGAINATHNFWGTATGPGTLTTPQPEPADNVCDDITGSSTSVAPFATKQFTVETPLVEPGL
jgi:parallel beta-helix repeat protein